MRPSAKLAALVSTYPKIEPSGWEWPPAFSIYSREADMPQICHRSTSATLIGDIAVRTGLHPRWDRGGERFTNSTEANKYLHFEYRAPGTLGWQERVADLLPAKLLKSQSR